MTRRLLAAGLLAAGVAAAGPSGPAVRAERAFALTSATFRDGGPMPERAADAVRGSCAGQNLSPQLSWTGAPARTRSFALIIFDPQGRNGLGDFRFVGYGIPTTVTAFAEGEVSARSDKFVGGANTEGRMAYSGPCPAKGPPHRYAFVLIATDLERDALPPGLSVEALLPKLEGHSEGSTGMVGLFGEP
ncbi:MAG: YbhB/YbcL family Raf kinase inhibitor-like protein [Roseiarcus sp.]|jgi:Raf kinase inhibitor-like YbhB/YbcL family protein